MKEPLAYKTLMLMRKRAGQAFDAVDWTDLFEKEYGYRCICVDRRVSQNTGRGYGYAEKTGGVSERGLVLYRVSEKGLGITNFQEFLKNRVVKKYPKKERIRSSMDETAVKKECKSLNWTDSIVEEHKTEMNGVSKYETSNGSIVFGPSGMKKECKMMGETIKSTSQYIVDDKPGAMKEVVIPKLVSFEKPRYKKVRDYIVR